MPHPPFPFGYAVQLCVPAIQPRLTRTNCCILRQDHSASGRSKIRRVLLAPKKHKWVTSKPPIESFTDKWKSFAMLACYTVYV